MILKAGKCVYTLEVQTLDGKFIEHVLWLDSRKKALRVYNPNTGAQHFIYMDFKVVDRATGKEVCSTRDGGQ